MLSKGVLSARIFTLFYG
ncbi:hypothetical protein PS042_13535 [Escherichia albertii]|uniref:Uncharacterized protein n=1 Tax=Escherichia albertii TaxID=208962 RepID=A0AAX4AIC6_ESCAL|nr:hypothetical protein [Escherichia albertii]MCB2258882.1 hypothetical protein [Escherichia albertii]MCB2266160.1 hypothetical protein [Escherichia albertii]MCB2270883.1 hypothetical protein [Escherichia albertii]MCJ2197128.1 hypothetical protein [Escherichia albertii NBRC 107761 = DSM 17582]MCQ8908339.1 hypothetical protein [Escherichia albertii]